MTDEQTTSADDWQAEKPLAAPAPLSEAEQDAAALARWKRIGWGMSEVIEWRVDEFAQERGAADRETDDARIRKVSALVIAAQRSMEMRDTYESSRNAAAVSAESFEALKRRHIKELEEFEAGLDAELAARRDASASVEKVDQR